MLLVGIYVSTLPGVLEEYFSGYSGVNFSHVSMFGMNIDTQTSSGIFMVYVALALLTGLVGTVWHLMLLLYTKWRIQKFSIGDYFKGYFPRIYGLLWATCSEALATPLNMYLMRRHYPEIETSVRQFTIGCGSVFFVNGTLICCFVMIPAVCMMLNLEVAVVHLLYCLPVIYILSFGIPGIPGELVLFAGPIMGMLAIPAELQPAFLLIFLGLQIGLPDSFRTATNSTEACLSALLLNRIYKRRYWSEAEPTSQVAGLIPLEATPSLKHGDQ
jgi:Na+/H+-dicarboxylate symporter